MDNEQELINLIERINADKSLTQPWKNYALSELRKGLACLKMATVKNYQSNNQTPQTGLETVDCICPEGARNADCRAKVHNA